MASNGRPDNQMKGNAPGGIQLTGPGRPVGGRDIALKPGGNRTPKPAPVVGTRHKGPDPRLILGRKIF